MRLKIELISDDNVILPVGFNSNIQALIYNFLDKVDSNWLHESGYKFEKRSFKLFNFSSVLEHGKYLRDKKLFIFPHNVSFYVSSPLEWILEQLAKNSIKSETVRLGNNVMRLNSINVMKPIKFDSDEAIVSAMTPIEVHSTFQKEDGKKLTYYYSPYEEEFTGLINANLRKKWTALFKRECDYDIMIKPLFSGNGNERIVYFGTGKNKTVIKGWKGRFKVKGHPEFLAFAYDAGLGSRNSQGFGMVEIMRRKT